MHFSMKLFNWANKILSNEELLGALIVEKALSAPLKRIVVNAGQNGAIITEKIKDSEFKMGYDAATNQFINMYDEGIIDPAKVTRSTLQNAASIASMVLTTECIIVDKVNKN
jgi:chaperonin GroEL